ncbi:MAG: tRNA pseudouridine(55) synthase TruB [Planctomycetes bacterium]|nr:tRNA pseudouridine(55) synthase TruB [Planctomycetota bacterium]
MSGSHDSGNSVTPAGLLVIDKQPGFTSMDICAILRTRFRRGGAPKRLKVGHAGTLDPLATGVLVVLVGKATRAVNALMATEKEYEAEIDLSRRSTSDDLGGSVSAVAVDAIPDRAGVESVLRRFVGVVDQLPPQFSAMKVGGVRAYQLAREGTEAPLKPRAVQIHEIELREYAWPMVRVRVRCGKGVYIRSLARDVGAALKTGGVLTALRRTRVGDFVIGEAKTIDDLPQVLGQEHLADLPALMIPPASAETRSEEPDRPR